MVLYYGFMVDLMFNEVTELNQQETDFKPKHEQATTTLYAKWFIDKKEMLKTKEYTINKLKELNKNKVLVEI